MSKKSRQPRSKRDLSKAQILEWADEFKSRVGRWPTVRDGPIAGGLGLTWIAVDAALRAGSHGLACGSSLAQLLASERGYRNKQRLPKLTEREILAWADAFHERTQTWPKNESGPIPGSGGETWCSVHQALFEGLRGLPGGSSLPRLLARCRGVRHHTEGPRLSEAQILRWADNHFHRTRRWPIQSSGAVADAVEETWLGVDAALREGCRGLPGGLSLAQFLADRRGVRNRKNQPRLTTAKILAWADAHHARTGRWPGVKAGLIREAGDGQTWRGVRDALRRGHRGLPGGSSLSRFFRQHGRVKG